MIRIYKTNEMDEVYEEIERQSIRDFKVTIFGLPNRHNIWYLWVTVKNEYQWSRWSNKRDDWVLVNTNQIPKILQMRQLAGAL